MILNKIRKSGLIVVLFTVVILLNSIHADKVVNSQDNQNPVLLIHGWNGNKNHMNKIMDWLVIDGWDKSKLFAYSFTDPANCSIEKIAEDANNISQWVDDILNQTDSEKVDLIGYSQGGHSARYYVKLLGGVDKVDDFVSLGTGHYYLPEWNVPFCGPSLEAEQDLILALNDGDQSPGGILNDTIGSRQDPLNSSLVYNGGHIPGTINYTSIYGPDDVADPNYSPFLEGAHNILVESGEHSTLVVNRDAYEKIKPAIKDFIVESSIETKLSDTTSSSTGSKNETNSSTDSLTLQTPILWLSIMILVNVLGKRNGASGGN